MREGNFRRGFKADCERLSVEEREGLGLKAWAPLDPLVLADEHGVPVVTFVELSAHTTRSTTIAHLVFGAGSDAVSAFTVCQGSRRLIAVNPNHSLARQASSIAHELSHILLEHDPDQTLLDEGMLTGRAWTPEMEAEASWCGGVLLLPRPAAVVFARNPSQRDQLQARYGVSQEMIEWRLRVTGAGRSPQASG
jgi:Zn-dependent peptidase ImmA (M78 family)